MCSLREFQSVAEPIRFGLSWSEPVIELRGVGAPLSGLSIYPCLTSSPRPHYWLVMQSNPLTTLSLTQLKRGVAIREQIESLENELERITGAQAAPEENGAPRRKKRRMSAAARARISAAMKARWAQRARK